MKEELSNKLVEILTAIQAGVGKASDFAVDQLPDVAQQYIAFGRAYETMFILVLIAVALACIAIIVWGWKNLKELDDVIIFITMVPGCAALFCMLFAFFELKDFLMVWFAPKIYLIKGLASLIK